MLPERIGPSARRVTGYATILATLLVSDGDPRVASADSIQGGRVAVHAGRLTVDLQNAPLTHVLRAIGEQAAVEVVVRGDIDTRITQSLTDVPLDEAIERLARGHSVVLSYGERGGRPILVKVWVFENALAAPTQVRLDPERRSARLRIVRELSRRRDQAAATELARIATADVDPIVRIQGLHALRRARGLAALGPLRQALLDDPDPRVRRSAALALAALRSEEARRALEAAGRDPDASVRRAARAALHRWNPSPR